MTFGYSSDTLSKDVQQRISCTDQMFNVEAMQYSEGIATGLSTLQVRNPGGISFEVLCDRCLDIGWADCYGIPIAYRSQRGPVSSQHYDPYGNGWIHSFSGGLLSTCGLDNIGLPVVDSDGEYLGLHGRIGHIPAENIQSRFDASLFEGKGGICIEGDIFETALGKQGLCLHRTINASVCTARIEINDIITNLSQKAAQYLFRHHINFGYPIIDEGTQIWSQSKVIGSRDGGNTDFCFPITLKIQDSTEQVLYCSSINGKVEAELRPLSGENVQISSHADDWKYMILWRDANEGVNVFAVEPSTAKDEGKVQAQHDGDLVTIRPGESRRYYTEIIVTQ